MPFFDSLVHDRQHREKRSFQAAAEFLADEKGKSFDPVLVDAFLGRIDDMVAIIESMPD